MEPKLPDKDQFVPVYEGGYAHLPKEKSKRPIGHIVVGYHGYVALGH